LHLRAMIKDVIAAQHGEDVSALLGHGQVRSTLGFTCGARLNDRPATNENGRTSAPRLVQALVLRRAHSGDRHRRLNLHLMKG